MRLSKEQRRIWKEWVSKPLIIPDEEELWWVISALLADLEEAELATSTLYDNARIELARLQDELAATRKQLAQAHAGLRTTAALTNYNNNFSAEDKAVFEHDLILYKE